MFSSYFSLVSTRYLCLLSFWHQIFIGSFFLLGIRPFLIGFFLSRHQVFLNWLLSSWHQIFIGVFRVWRRSSLKEFLFSFQRPTCRGSPAASAPQPWSREGFPRLEKLKEIKPLMWLLWDTLKLIALNEW